LRRGDAGDLPVTGGTITNVRAVLRAALADAVRQQLVPRNVAALVTVPPARRARPIALPADRLAAFLAAAEHDELRALWVMAAVYGMRRAELVGLRWSDLDESAQRFWVRQTAVDVAGSHSCAFCGATHARLRFDTPKSAAGERIYPLVPAVADVLAEHRRTQDRDRELYAGTYRDHGLAFARPDGNPWRPDWISQEFRRLMHESGAGEGFERTPSLKALRSTMVTNLHEAGTPLEVISKVTGHAGGEVTRDHYLAVSAERTRPEFQTVAERLLSPPAATAGDVVTRYVTREAPTGRRSERRKR